MMKHEYKTKARGLIIDYLQQNAGVRFTARDVFEQLKAVGENIDRATVYRNLEKLCTEGKLLRYRENDSQAACYQYSEGYEQCDRHLHAQCLSCGRVFHLENEFVEEFEKKIQATYGIGVDCSKTMIVGRCDDCKTE